MAVIVNRNTTQAPNTTVGLTGTQVIKFINAPRVYIKTLDSSPTPVVVKSNGTTPSGWTDLGSVDGMAKVTYTKDVKEVRLGMDEILMATYVGKKTAGFEFSLTQFDDIVLQNVSGLTASTTTAGSIVSYGVGSEDVVQKALLLVAQNKLDGKEMQFYSPLAYLTFAIEDSSGALVLKANANLPSFAWTTGGTTFAYFVSTIFA